MKLVAVILENFRIYRQRTRVDLADLTALIGRNDVGKSSILEALEIFFNNDLIKVDSSDISSGSGERRIDIGCVFSELPMRIVLDERATTNLREEHLLNENGLLEVHKTYDYGTAKPREEVYAWAVHPTAQGASVLLQLKHQELRERFDALGIAVEGIDLRSNPALRRAIWRNTEDLRLAPSRVPLNEEDAKRIWDKLKKELPVFALFRADRPSKDEDPEVQDPLKLAVQEAIREVEQHLGEIKGRVQEKATSVAQRTLDKLREIDPALAGRLTPDFRTEPKWEGLFKLTLMGDDGIPMNKRGSGVRRLILLSFFRAQAERGDETITNIIYAIEEPETSQHPTYQRLIVKALSDLAAQGHRQILLTTHVPGLASLLSTQSLRHVVLNNNGDVQVLAGADIDLGSIAADLGILPDNRVMVLVCVEGPNDINFLRAVSRLLHTVDQQIPDLGEDPRVAILPLGGSTLQQWVDNRYLRGLGKPEVHIYDRGADVPPQYQTQVHTINARGDNSHAMLTDKREIENYLHPDAIQESIGVAVTFGDQDSVPEIVARAVHETAADTAPWNTLDAEVREKKISNAKRRLSDAAVKAMTFERLQQMDTNSTIENWLREISRRLI